MYTACLYKPKGDVIIYHYWAKGGSHYFLNPTRGIA